MVPHLITAQTGPINEFEQRLLETMPAIERWFRLEWMEHTPPFYTSVDLRNAGFKLAPVDTNLFPSGFDHLTPSMLPLAVQAATAAIEKICPDAKNLLLVPESTSDASYLAHIQRLSQIFNQAGLNVRLGTVDESVRGPFDAKLPDGSTLTIEPVVRTRRRVGLGEGLKHFDPCTVLLNTDLARGAPPSIVNLNEQFLLPPLHAGWTVRRKSRHFHAYDEVAKRFAKLVSMDPWLLAPLVAACGEVNLREARGLDCVKTHTDALLTKIRRKYKDYGITERPFVVVKPDDGIPGMDMITVHDAAEIDALAQAALGSGAAEGPHALIVQEGVPTHERVNDAVAEPVVYMIDRYVVGGFYRVHAARGVDQNLDAPGAAFVPLAFADSPQLPRRGERPGASPPNRFYMYGVVARLAMLAASYELEATDPQALEAA